MEQTSRRNPFLVPGIVIGVIVLAIVLFWFAPQTLFLGREVDEALPGAPATGAPEGTESATEDDAGADADGATGTDADGATAAAEPVELARGAFAPLGNHTGVGTALLLDVSGTPFVRFEDFETTNGPDLRVYLSTAPADAEESEHDEDFVDLGPLTASRGAQNYEVPAGTDLDRFRSVVVWCRRFSVGFAVAPLG